MLRKTLMGIVILQVLFWGFWLIGMTKPTQMTNADRLVEFRENGKVKFIALSGLRHMEARVKANAHQLGLKMKLVDIEELFKSKKLTPSQYVSNTLKTDAKFTAMLQTKKEKTDRLKFSLVLVLLTIFAAAMIMISFLLTQNMNQSIYNFIKEQEHRRRQEEQKEEARRLARFLDRKHLNILDLIFGIGLQRKECRNLRNHIKKKCIGIIDIKSEPNQSEEKGFELIPENRTSLKDFMAQQKVILELLKKPPQINRIKIGRRPKFLLPKPPTPA